MDEDVDDDEEEDGESHGGMHSAWTTISRGGGPSGVGVARLPSRGSAHHPGGQDRGERDSAEALTGAPSWTSTGARTKTPRRSRKRSTQRSTQRRNASAGRKRQSEEVRVGSNSGVANRYSRWVTAERVPVARLNAPPFVPVGSKPKRRIPCPGGRVDCGALKLRRCADMFGWSLRPGTSATRAT
eukprot:792250-Pyramimonas_sp.AAC.1